MEMTESNDPVVLHVAETTGLIGDPRVFDPTRCFTEDCGVKFTCCTRRHRCTVCEDDFCFLHCDNWAASPHLNNFDPKPMCHPCFCKETGMTLGQQYIVSGEAAHSPLVMLNAAMTPALFLQQQAATLAKEAEMRVFLVEYPGIGSEPYQDNALTETTIFERILGMLSTEREARKVVLFGHAMGGFVAMKFAIRYPEKVAGLVVSGTTTESEWRMRNWEGWKYRTLSRRHVWGSIRDSFGVGTARSEVKEVDWSMFTRSGLQFRSWDACVDLMVQQTPNFFSFGLAGLKAPIMFINGERDNPLTTPAFLARFETRPSIAVIPGARSETMLMSSHWPKVMSFVCGFMDTANLKAPPVVVHVKEMQTGRTLRTPVPHLKPRIGTLTPHAVAHGITSPCFASSSSSASSDSSSSSSSSSASPTSIAASIFAALTSPTSSTVPASESTSTSTLNVATLSTTTTSPSIIVFPGATSPTTSPSASDVTPPSNPLTVTIFSPVSSPISVSPPSPTTTTTSLAALPDAPTALAPVDSSIVLDSNITAITPSRQLLSDLEQNTSLETNPGPLPKTENSCELKLNVLPATDSPKALATSISIAPQPQNVMLLTPEKILQVPTPTSLTPPTPPTPATLTPSSPLVATAITSSPIKRVLSAPMKTADASGPIKRVLSAPMKVAGESPKQPTNEESESANEESEVAAKPSNKEVESSNEKPVSDPTTNDSVEEIAVSASTSTGDAEAKPASTSTDTESKPEDVESKPGDTESNPTSPSTAKAEASPASAAEAESKPASPADADSNPAEAESNTAEAESNTAEAESSTANAESSTANSTAQVESTAEAESKPASTADAESKSVDTKPKPASASNGDKEAEPVSDLATTNGAQEANVLTPIIPEPALAVEEKDKMEAWKFKKKLVSDALEAQMSPDGRQGKLKPKSSLNSSISPPQEKPQHLLSELTRRISAPPPLAHTPNPPAAAKRASTPPPSKVAPPMPSSVPSPPISRASPQDKALRRTPPFTNKRMPAPLFGVAVIPPATPPLPPLPASLPSDISP